MYFTDRGIEELEDRRGEEEVSLAWLADRLRASGFQVTGYRLELVGYFECGTRNADFGIGEDDAGRDVKGGAPE